MWAKVRISITAFRRYFRSRGFGIQSPWAYSFNRYVINERYPYYFYKELDAMHPRLSHIDRKLCLLYFRIANYLQPANVFDTFHTRSAFEESFIAGCAKTHYIHTLDNSQLTFGDGPNIYICDINNVDLTSRLLEESPQKSLLIVTDIHASHVQRGRWEVLAADTRTGVCFDLYHCGLVFFDNKKTKQNYVIYF